MKPCSSCSGPRTTPSTATNKVLKRELVKQGLEFDDPVWVREERGTAYPVQR